MTAANNPLSAAPASLHHVAIIMDGNGRWAASRNLPRAAGHKAGADAVKRTIQAAAELGVKFLTLYSFSTENWQRPTAEVEELMGLLRFYLKSELPTLHKEGTRLVVIGEREQLPEDICAQIAEAENLTAQNTRLTLVMALSYGSRQEIAMAAQRLAQNVKDGKLAITGITPDLLGQNLYTQNIPDPDLIIRTSGEQRLSNFLLWQAAYAEFVFLDTFWPDFERKDLEKALTEYRLRERRFGRRPTKEPSTAAG